MAASPQRKEEKRFNADYLAGLLEYLETASMDAAIAEYNRLLSIPEGDDWLVAELGRQDLAFLLARLLRRPDVLHPWVYERIREVEKAPDDHLDLWAREHYKSTIITFGLTIQDILRDQEITVGLFSHTRPNSKGFMGQIKTEFEVNTDLIALYPEVLWSRPKSESPRWSEDEGIIVRRKGNPKEATLEAWGLVDGQPVGKHFGLLLYDDIIVPKSVTTPEMMAKTTAMLELSYNLGAEEGLRRFAGTRYHFNDPYRVIIERGTAKLRLYDGTEGNRGDIKRPVLFSKELMAKKRRDMGPYTFACQILQNPRADATHGFQREWLEYWTPDRGHGLNKYILVDPASKKKKHSDYTSMWVLGLGFDGNYWVLEVVRDRMNLTERTKRLIEMHKKWKPLEVRYEEYGLQADIEHIKTEMTRLKYRFDIEPVGGKIAKTDRIKRLIPLFEKHQIILPTQFSVTTQDHETKDMIHEFVENEYMAFPVPVHDDMLDALARITESRAVGGKALKLEWPDKPRRVTGNVQTFEPLDPGMGM